MGFGQRVKRVLDTRGIKPADLSRELGWNTGALSQYIKNPDRSPTLSTACKIALALDVSLDYLAGLIDEPRPIQRGADGLPVMSETEERLLGLYRDANAQGQSTIMGVAQLQQGVDGASDSGKGQSVGGRLA